MINHHKESQKRNNPEMQDFKHRFIRGSTKPVTILFTDIVDSTRFWDIEGDLKGRLMVDQHNRLVFPVIKKFKGKIIKTIGDSVMASFDSPDNALRAGIGIQQSLEAYRNKNKNFNLEIRIGMHTGEALVEKRDVFGDTVNIAARVESEAGANEILVSKATKDQIEADQYSLTRKTSFIPKGKSKKLSVSKSDWKSVANQIDGIDFDAVLPIMAQQRTEILLQIAVFLGLLYYVIQNYLRFLLADQEFVYLISFSPEKMVSNHPFISVLVAIAAFEIVRLVKYLTVAPILPFRILKAGFGYAVAFAIVLSALTMLPIKYTGNSHETFSESKHLFVKVVQDSTNIRKEPSLSSEVVTQGDDGDLYLLADVRENGDMVWNRILIGIGEYGWIARAIPASFGVAEERLTITNKRYFKYRDLYAFLFAIIGALWGFFSFSVRPL